MIFVSFNDCQSFGVSWDIGIKLSISQLVDNCQAFFDSPEAAAPVTGLETF